jgi:hypothetical protein
MAPPDVLIFSLLFPSAAAMIGAYLVFRGISRLVKTGGSIICGKVKCKKVVKSIASGRECALYRTIVEIYKNGHWRYIYSVQHGTSFLLGRREVAESVVHLKLSKPVVIHGTITNENGLIEKGIDTLKGSAIYKIAAAPISAVLPFFASPVYGPLSEAVLVRLQKDPGAGAALKHHKASLIRITEHALTNGMEVCAITEASSKSPLKGTIEFPLILSDMRPEYAAESLKERSLLSIVAGAVLIVISVPLFVFLLSQL